MSASPGQGINSMIWFDFWFSFKSALVRSEAMVPGVAKTKIFLALVLAASLMAGSVPTNCNSGYC